jgi:hypothetical protein
MPGRSVIRRCVVSTIALLTLFPPWRHAQSEPLRLNVELDDSTYLVGQPIHAVLSVSNKGAIAFDDLSSLDPVKGHLLLNLTNLGSGFAVPFTGQAPFRYFGVVGTFSINWPWGQLV